MRNILFFELSKYILIVSKTQKLLKPYQISFHQYVALSNESYHISSTYSFGLLIIRPEVKDKSYHISSMYCFGLLTICRDFVLKHLQVLVFHVDCQLLNLDEYS